MSEPRLVVDAKNKLGEVPVWCPIQQALYWVDIEGRLLQRLTPATGLVRRWTMPERIGSFALRAGGGLVCAFASGFAFFDLETEAVEWIARPEAAYAAQPLQRRQVRPCRPLLGRDDGRPAQPSTPAPSTGSIPTAACTAWPRAWASATASPGRPTTVFSTSPTRWTGRSTPTTTTPPSGAIANRRVFADHKDQPGNPDGSTIDAEGFLWNAQWDGWRLVRFAPDGRVDRVVPLPVQKPTSCMFGGPDLGTLYVTSAIWDLEGEALARQPWAGGLLALDVGVRGLPEPRFAG